MASEPKQRRSGQSQKAETPGDGAPGAAALATNWLDAVWKLSAAAAAIAIAVAAWLQWTTLSRMERLMSATQRPWVGAAVEPVQLVFDDKGGGITLNMTIKNSGDVPAVDVLTSPVLLLDDKQPYRKACGHYGVGGGIGPTLARDESLPKTSTVWLPRREFGEKFPVLLAVCIKYRFANSRRIGEAGYFFAILQREAGQPDRATIETKNGTLKSPELALLPTGSYQD
jgi:hypothetical protein